MTYEEKHQEAMKKAQLKYNEDWDDMDIEAREYSAWEVYQQLCWQEEAEYWVPIMRSMERDKEEK